MRQFGAFLLGVFALSVWHTLRQWGVPLTDGQVWQRLDSCRWVLRNSLPYFTETALRAGDTLLRIDYQPVCGLTSVPPSEAPHSLFLYEIERQGEKRLIFVESIVAFPLGWPRSTQSYFWTESLTIVLFLLVILLLLFVGEKGDILPLLRRILWLSGALLSWGSLWVLWAGKGRYDTLWLGRLILTGWTVWAAATQIPSWRALFLALPLPFTFILPEKGLYFLSETVIGSMSLALPAPWYAIYAVGWIAWGIWREPLLLILLGGSIILHEARLIGRSLAVLSPEGIALRFLAWGVGIAVGWIGKTPIEAISYGAAGLLGSILLAEGGRRLIQSRQRRVRLLQERLPLLWEQVERAALLSFAEETLRAYGEVEQIFVARAEMPTGAKIPWLRRSGDPPPFLPIEVPFKPDAALPLPAYGWLFLKEGKRPLRSEDLRRLIPFAAGLSIALRHAELFEAAHEARLAALRGQLSPHFLFNALNTLQSLIGENPALAEALMSRLGALLRRSLSHARHLTVPLSEELELVRDYLAIEEERFGKRLQVVWDIPDPCPLAEIPPFTIQLLAENVIKHAVSRLRRPVRMEIRISETTHHTIIEVIDDGPGIDPTQIGKSVGLSNLMMRLEQLYGKKAELRAERLNPGTRIQITLPRLQPSDARTHNPAEGHSAHER